MQLILNVRPQLVMDSLDLPSVIQSLVSKGVTGYEGSRNFGFSVYHPFECIFSLPEVARNYNVSGCVLDPGRCLLHIRITNLGFDNLKVFSDILCYSRKNSPLNSIITYMFQQPRISIILPGFSLPTYKNVHNSMQLRPTQPTTVIDTIIQRRTFSSYWHQGYFPSIITKIFQRWLRINPCQLHVLRRVWSQISLATQLLYCCSRVTRLVSNHYLPCTEDTTSIYYMRTKN